MEAAPTFWEQYPSICRLKQFCSTISLSVFPWLEQSILAFFVWAYKSLKASWQESAGACGDDPVT